MVIYQGRMLKTIITQKYFTQLLSLTRLEQAQQQMKTAMHKNLERMNLVSREEFEAQVLLLEKAEARIAALEAKLNDQ